jgi:translation initiation factor 2 gamma subunit (eIF-2gamma)
MYLSASQTYSTFGTLHFNIHLIAAARSFDVNKPNTEVGELKGGSSVLTNVIVELRNDIS